MDALTPLQAPFLIASSAAALLAALWSVRQGLFAADAKTTGELVWALVAGATLAGVLLSVLLRPDHGL